MKALGRAKERGATILLISHKLAAFALANKLLVLVGGQVTQFGLRDEVLAKITPKKAQAQPAIKPGPAKLTEARS
jgi:ABC-type protease/lipase transport system fused ATPase/permease subunit